MKYKHKISVIIPVYNVEKYLSQCLDSVINQTLQDIEIICIDDGSTDNSLNILKEYANKDKRIKIIKQKNKGAGAARNRGLDKASGEYIYFLDGDDYLQVEEALKKTYKKLINTNAEICIFRYNKLHESTQELKQCKWKNFTKNIPDNEIFNKSDIPENIFQYCNIPAWTKLYKTSFIKKNKIRFQNLRTCNDVFFNFATLAIADKITFINKNFITWRIEHSNNLTATRGKHIHCILDAFTSLKKFLQKRKIFNQLEETYYKRAEYCFNFELGNIEDQELKDYWTLKLYRFLPKTYWIEEVYKLDKIDKQMKKERLLNLFSIRNIETHKVITLLGMKLKIKSQKLVERENLNRINKKVNRG